MSQDSHTQTFRGVEANTQTTPRMPAQTLSYQQGQQYQYQQYQPPQGFYEQDQSQFEKTANIPRDSPYGLNPLAYGQPVTSYNNAPVQPGQPQQPLDLQNMYPNIPPENRSWRISKLVGHGISIVASIIVIGLTADYLGVYDYGYLAYGMLPLACVALLWSIAEYTTFFVRGCERSIHPGAHVGVSLVLWLAFGVVTGLGGAVAGIDDYDYYCGDVNEPYDSQYADPGYCGGDYTSKRTLYIVSLAFSGILFVVHLALFIGACVDTHRRNSWTGRQVIYVPSPMQWGGPAGGGWQKMGQNNSGVPMLVPSQYSQVPPFVPPVKHDDSSQHLSTRGNHPDAGIPLQDRTPSLLSEQNENRNDNASELGSSQIKGKQVARLPSMEDNQPEASGSGAAGSHSQVTEYYARPE